MLKYNNKIVDPAIMMRCTDLVIIDHKLRIVAEGTKEVIIFSLK